MIKPNKNKTKVLGNKPVTPTDRQNKSQKPNGKIGDEYQESLREDMRGPTEGMEEIVVKK